MRGTASQFFTRGIGRLANMQRGAMIALAVAGSFVMTIAALTSSASAAVCSSSTVQFCWYSDANFSGSTYGGWTNPQPNQCIGMAGFANDTLSSAANWSNYTAILYMDANCTGFGIMLPPWSSRANYSGSGFNDETSSYIFVQ